MAPGSRPSRPVARCRGGSQTSRPDTAMNVIGLPVAESYSSDTNAHENLQEK